ncbi:MAG: DNA mismatch repair endonuclease MutL, partial [Armatimonadota bacterium]|nr:DNA mismatch repair endonuclease MutL [Armatimonadota bacterium]
MPASSRRLRYNKRMVAQVPIYLEECVETRHFAAVTVLSPDLASKIAAGECVERPASVVKELVENSLDAGATRITVEMEDGGRLLIRVSDNGHGIDREDLVLSVQRHATSKLTNLEDLASIRTLGFRGEALPSIAAVSRLEILSGVRDGTPSRLTMIGSEIEDLRSAGAPVGATVTVRDLFFNTPARLKFLRSAQTEFGHALEHITRLAISHHTVAFRVIHNGREALNTPGSPDPLNAMVSAYGPDIGREMIAVNYDVPPLKVYGYISRPALTRANRGQQSFFVNRRWVRNRTIGHALDQGYRTLLTVGRHPIAALLLDVSPELVDVNVHPTKAEVRFVRDWEIHQAAARAVKDALMAVDLVPHVQVAKGADPEFIQTPLPYAERSYAERPPDGTGLGAVIGSWEPQSEHPGEPLWTARESGQWPDNSGSVTCGPLRGARIVGQMHRCYILLENAEGILLVDQHAAHERILYEKFLHRAGQQDVQRLVVPIMLSLGHREA